MKITTAARIRIMFILVTCSPPFRSESGCGLGPRSPLSTVRRPTDLGQRVVDRQHAWSEHDQQKLGEDAEHEGEHQLHRDLVRGFLCALAALDAKRIGLRTKRPGNARAKAVRLHEHRPETLHFWNRG